MENQNLQNEFQSLERKINLLLNQFDGEKQRNEQLKIENEQLSEKLKAKSEQIQSFQNQIKISKIAGSIGTDNEDVSKLKDKIDDYVNEIDYCVAQLSQ
jgi:peptidoglycan hydrolase CwlO-like protein